MTLAVTIVNLVLGVAYTSYGVLTALEMKRGWKTMGFSHFGAAWITMAFTCGPHHLAHGLHTAVEGRVGGGLDLFSVAFGLPVGVIWLYLRVEAMTGGRGDRAISGTPLWLSAMPTIIAIYLTALTFGVVGVVRAGVRPGSFVTPNMLLLVIYFTIGYFVMRTQLRNYSMTKQWSVSGLCLSAIFPTCGLMHAVFGLYNAAGLYRHDIHGFIIDWLAVPAGLYFLWVVRSLHRGSLADWNDRKRTVVAA